MRGGIRRNLAAALRVLVFAALLWPTAAAAGHDNIPTPPPSSTAERLNTLQIDRQQITVSGLSSGGFFAHQFHLAYSGVVRGAGIIAGGPFGCAEQFLVLPVFLPPATAAALYVCTHYFGALPFQPSVEGSVRVLEKAGSDGHIDPLDNLRDDRVWLFHGREDTLVPKTSMDVLHSLYRRIGVTADNLVWFEPGPDQSPANHGIPIQDLRNAHLPDVSCGEHRTPFVVRCDYEAAGLLLRHLYPAGFREAVASPHDHGALVPFDQTEFFDPADNRASLSKVGYVYVPDECRTQACRLHVVFHGCRQNVDAVDDDFVRDAGHNRWAAANRIVVLYPQTRPWLTNPIFPADPSNLLANPNACWDFWGYSGLGYHGRSGKQMQAVKAMVDRLTGP